MVVSDDGLVVESALPAGFDADELAALTTTATRAIASLTTAARGGELVQVVIDGSAGTVVVQRLPNRASLLVLARAGGDLGQLLYDLRRHAPALVALL